LSAVTACCRMAIQINAVLENQWWHSPGVKCAENAGERNPGIYAAKALLAGE